MKTDTVTEIFKKINSFKQHKRRVEYMKDNWCTPVTTVIMGNFNDRINLKMPEGTPPYTPKKDAVHNEKVYQQAQLLLDFSQHQWAREKMFIDMLETLPPEDAELFIAMKDKKVTDKYPNITLDLVKEVWPQLLK